MSKNSKSLVKAILDPDDMSEDQKLFDQFTKEGLDVLVEFYNQKYPQRPTVHHVVILKSEREKEESILKDAKLDAASQLNKLREKNPNQIIKILFTLGEKNNDSKQMSVDAYHSTPAVLTDNKLILLRDEYRYFTIKFFSQLAQHLNLEFVQQIPVNPNTIQKKVEYDPDNKEFNERTSMQGDLKSCQGIGVGILKDLTHEDLETISGFQNQYQPLPKMLKYSQSKKHISKNFPAIEPKNIKAGSEELSLSNYLDLHTDKKKLETRIDSKLGKLRTEMAALDKAGDSQASANPRALASKLLDQHLANKGKGKK